MSQFIGLRKFDMVKKCIRQILVYHLGFMLLITAVNFAIKNALLGFFFVEQRVRQASESTMTLFVLDLLVKPFVYMIASILRWVQCRSL